MGDPPRRRNKYEKPKRLWDTERLEEDGALKKTYGLKNMREIWLAMAVLKKYRREARRLLSLTVEERKLDSEKVIARLVRLGILKTGAALDDILSLDVKDVLERRLQSIVLRKGLAYTSIQSRQLITHGFIAIGDRKISIPSYLVFTDEEKDINYSKPIELKRQHEKPAEEAAEKPAEAVQTSEEKPEEPVEAAETAKPAKDES